MLKRGTTPPDNKIDFYDCRKHLESVKRGTVEEVCIFQ